MAKTIIFVAIALLVVGVGGFAYLGQKSKSGSAPGLVDGTLAPCPDSPNCVSSETGTVGDKKVADLPLEAWDALPATVEAMGGRITTQGDDYIAAEFSSATFGFVDDLELRKSDDAVHVRSASRVGYSDAGANAKRVAELRSRLP